MRPVGGSGKWLKDRMLSSEVLRSEKNHVFLERTISVDSVCTLRSGSNVTASTRRSHSRRKYLMS